MHLLSTSTSSSNSNTSGSSLGPTVVSRESSASHQGARHRTRNTPHGALTLHKIARIKMLDRHSCYVTGIQKEIACREILSKPAFFGQFGEISSIRILRDRDPGEVYLRFHCEKDAIRAIAWANSQSPRGISAQHGYQKYCIKFIDNKRCKRPNCPHRHSWCPEKDIIPSASAITKATKCLIASDIRNGSIHPQRQWPATNNAAMETSRIGEPEMMNRNGAGFVMLQSQFMELKRQYVAQRELMRTVMFNVEQLKAENLKLREENQFLSLMPGSMEGLVGDVAVGGGGYHDTGRLTVDGLSRNGDFDEGLVDQIVQDIFATDPVLQSGRRF